MVDLSEKRWILVNGKLCEEYEYYSIINSRESYAYEVVRVIEGKPLFLDEHIERFDRTLEGLGAKSLLTPESVKSDIERLFNANNVKNDNVKIIYFGGTVYMVLVRAYYPSQKEFNDGVKVGILRAMRVNPQAKVSDSALRELADRRIAETDVYEVLLLDREDCVTEGSRSNVFFVKNGTVFTSPAEGVLLGITRQIIVKLCEDNNIPVIEKEIDFDSFGSYDAAFISGTSPKVLPISCISNSTETGNSSENIYFSPDEPTVKNIMKLYEQSILDNLYKA